MTSAQRWWVVRPSSAPAGISIGTGAALVVVAATVCAAATAPGAQVTRLVVLAGVVGGFAALCGDLAAAVPVGALAWLVLDGFLVDRDGELAWHGSADALRLAVLAAAVGAGWLASAVWAARASRASRFRARTGSPGRAR